MSLEDSFETKYIKYLTLFLVGGFILMMTIVMLLDDTDEFTEITRDTEISGYISNIRREHGMLYFNIQDTLKYKVSGHMNNYQYSQDDFFFFLSSSDWLVKKGGTDTLQITRLESSRRRNNYIFVLGQQLNKELIKKMDH